MQRREVLVTLAAVTAVPHAWAHHGWSSFDTSRPIYLAGRIARLSWANPHGTAEMRWQGKAWHIVLAPTGRMESRGLSEAMIAPGKKIAMTGYARRDGTAEMRIERITADGKTVELR